MRMIYQTRRLDMKQMALLALGVVLAAANVSFAAPGKEEEKNPVVVMETSMGTIEIELYKEKAPITVKNFMGYVDDKFYDGLIFHRIIGTPSAKKDFMIQGGGYEP